MTEVVFPLSFWDISLWLAYASIILLATSEFLSYYGTTNLIINRKRLRTAALTLSILFIFTLLMRVYEITIPP